MEELRINKETISHIAIQDIRPLDIFYKPSIIKVKWFGLYTKIVQEEGYYQKGRWLDMYFCSVENLKGCEDTFDKDGQLYEYSCIKIFCGEKQIKRKFFKTFEEAKQYTTETFPNVNIIM